MTPRNGCFVRTARNVGIVASATIAVGTILALIAQFAWGVATRPIVTALREEQMTRALADSLVLVELRHLNGGFATLAEALRYPPGSKERARTLDNTRREGPGY